MEEKIKTHDDEIDLFELFQRVYREKWLIIGITVLTFLLSLIFTFLTPKAYKAEALYEINSRLPIVNYQEITETFKAYEKYTNPAFKAFKVKFTKVRDTQNTIKIETEASSPDDAKNVMEKVITLINRELFRKKVDDSIEKVKTRIEFINNALKDLKRSGIIYDPSKVADLLTEKQELEKWIKNPVIIRPLSEISLSPKPVKPKPLLNLSIGIVSGIFIGIFVALLKNALKERKFQTNPSKS